MNIFTRNKELNFSVENIESLTKSVTELKDVLTKIGTSVGQQELTNVLASAMKKNSKLFKKYVLTNELFGGAGALWELYCGNENLQSEFQNKFNNFCRDLIKIGIKNRRIKQVMW
ncbi:hypothetical protein [Winogradskyella marincola]|uniref:Uncharacterized protein n=1 Tax=Winogradskyella marincola TaxID=3037795 RepID=A0ABT6G5N4_9FLAO|nr:hypothetical protein [Winogradskyella sp. YYF002]MDG4717349.1 hypothetical protein [Winogradskyella sp. YYF002]